MTKKFFFIVAHSLLRVAQELNMTYNEVNVLVWYLFIPLSWCVMLDLIVHFPIFTPIWILLWAVILIMTRNHFSEWCDWAFQKSVDFLLWFQRIGWDYNKASVIICCLVPIPVYLILGYLLVASNK